MCKELMNIKKVQGSSVQEAVKIATAMYGDEISIIETKSLKGGLFGKSKGYEIVVSIPEEEEEFEQERRKSRFQSQLENRYGGGGLDLRIEDDSGVNLQIGKGTNRKISLLDGDEDEFISDKSYNRNLGKTPYAKSSSQRLPLKKREDTHIDVSENAKKIAELVNQKKREASGVESAVKSPIQKGVTTHKRSTERIVAETVEEERGFSKQSSSKKGSTDTGLFNEIKKEISQLNDKIKLIQNMFWEEKHPDNAISTTIPPEFSEIYRIAKQSGMNLEHLDMIMKLSVQHMPQKMRGNSETVKRYFKALLRKMIPVRAETLIKRPNKKIIMFVGSTGVGKTTTIAKLAARFTLQQDVDYRVGFIVLDTYKIGALEQLTQYARMMKLQIDTVVSAADFAEKLDQMSHNDYIFIDTMGSSPYDIEKIEMLQDFLDKGNYVHDIEVTLVLPSSQKFEDLKETYNSFSKLNIDTIIFTKLDETKGFGNIFSLVHDIQKPISYFTMGQEVPEDIVVAKSDYLVDSLLNGFKRDRYNGN
jgi:flagellar biosynthesis protein FlhF